MDQRQIYQAFLRNPGTGKIISRGAKIYKDLVKGCRMDPISEYQGEFEYLRKVSPHLLPPDAKAYEPRGVFVYDPARGRRISFEQATELLQQGRIARFIIDLWRQQRIMKEGDYIKSLPVDPTGQNTVIKLPVHSLDTVLGANLERP